MKDISDSIFAELAYIESADTEYLDIFCHNFSIISRVYNASIIDIDNFYETVTYISMNSSNNYDTIMNMPYWVFRNFMVHYNNIKERENKAQEGSTTSSDMLEQQKSMFSSSMNTNMKQMSKLHKPKFR